MTHLRQQMIDAMIVRGFSARTHESYLSAVNALADGFWESILEMSPTTATVYGDQRYDDRLPDPGPVGREKLRRVLTTDPGTGVMRHADAGYPEALEFAERHRLDLPGV